jgi:hypothetical protein
MRTLLEITADVEALDDLLSEVGGDVSDPRVEAAVSQWLSEIENDFARKVDNYVAMIRTIEARAEVRRAESKRLAERARIDEGSASWLRQRLIDVMHRLDRPSVETDRWRVSVARNGGLQPIEIVGDVPAEFRRVVSEPDNAAIRTALLEGRELGFAVLRDRGERLNVR